MSFITARLGKLVRPSGSCHRRASGVRLSVEALGERVSPTQLITNGGFEQGFLGWTALSQGAGAWAISTPGAKTPFSHHLTSGNAFGGAKYVVSDESGPSAFSLAQKFTVPVGKPRVMLSFQMFVNDFDHGPIISPFGLSTVPLPNQHARVDLLRAGASPFSTAPGDVIHTFYLGVDPHNNPNPYRSYSFDISPYVRPGQAYQIRFAAVDNQLFLNMGVDNVSIDATSLSHMGSLVGFGR